MEYKRDGQPCVAYAHREVVLCGGAVNSSQSADAVSDIGDRDHLTDHGIDTFYHVPQLGTIKENQCSKKY